MDTARWESLGFFAMRTPLLPFDELESLADSGVEAVDARIVELFRRPRVREALFLASPSLEERLSLLLAGGEETDLGKLQRSLLAYLTRMAARPTRRFAVRTDAGLCGESGARGQAGNQLAQSRRGL